MIEPVVEILLVLLLIAGAVVLVLALAVGFVLLLTALRVVKNVHMAVGWLGWPKPEKKKTRRR